jgi:chromosome partitioning protein
MTAPSRSQAQVITMLNLKGGVGKTHATWLLAAVCLERQQRMLLIDTDTQGNLSNSFLRETPHQPGVERLLDPSVDADIHEVIQRTAYPGIDIIPASGAVAPFDEADQSKWERADLHRSFVDPVRQVRADYDFIVFDCPPRLSLVSFAALCASDHVIVPLEAADWGAQGIVQVTEAAEYVRQRFNGGLRLLGYLVSRYKAGRSYQQTYLQGLRKHFGVKVFDTTIADLAGFERSVTDAVPITQHNSRGRPAAIARRFFDETCRRIAEAQPQGRGRVSAHHRVPAEAAA